MPHIFVSHATADDDTVSRIHDALEAATAENLWVDHKDIRPGDDWMKAIEGALRECDALLLCVSRTSVTRDEVTAEWRDALLRGRQLYIALIDDIPALDIPARLRLIQWVNLHTDWDRGIAALAAAIKGEAPPADAPVTTTRRVAGTIDRRLTTIPISGREADLAEIERLLKRGPTAILGVGGVGKSRLAAEIVVKGEGIDGAVWHTASDISRAEEVLELLREHFGLDAATERKDILAKLKQNKRLVVLDNAEDVPPGDPRAEYVALVDELVNAGALVLLTSRVEWDDIELCQNYSPQTLSNEAARQIVLDMAAAFAIPHDLTAQAEAIAAAARLHPRLIEWAVRLMRKFPPDKVIGDLKTLRSAKAQEALDEMILKTLRQMTDAEGETAEAVLKRLNVCRGGFTYEAAVKIALTPHGEVETDALDAPLETLQTWQFVTFDGNRYQIDPLVIAAVGEDETARRPHYDYYRALAEQHDKKQDYAGLDVESANLEAAFEWAMTTGDGEDALHLANAAMKFLHNRGRFAQVLEWHERVAAALAGHPDKLLRANAQNSLGIDYQTLPTGNRRDNLKRAVAAFEAALEYRTAEAAPLAYAMTQNNLGAAYAELARVEERELNLKRAVAAFEAALEYSTAEAAPLEYATTQNNLGNAYQALAGVEEREANLKQAVAAYEAALEYRTAEAAPLAYAMTQNNLGAAYAELARVEERELNLKRAVAAFEAALEYSTAEAAPLDYAMTQNNLGNAYQALAGVEERELNLKRAVAAYEAALEYSTAEAAPLHYAGTQNNLGLVYWNLAGIEERELNLKRAVAAYEAALEYSTAEAAPLAYAGTQNNLGLVYWNLAGIEERELNLKRAVAAYEAALEYYTPQAAPLAYAGTQNNLGLVYWNLSEIEEREGNLKRAVAAFEAALEYRTAEAAPLEYAATQNNLGNAYRDLAEVEERELNLKRAVAAYEAAVACWREAERYFRQMGHENQANRARRLIEQYGGGAG